MDLVLNEDQELIAKTALDYVSEHSPVSRFRALRDAKDALGYSRELFSEMAELGWTGIPFDEKVGGAGMGFAELVLVTEAAQPGSESSMFKVYGTELNKNRYELMVRIVGPDALGWEGPGFDDDALDLTRDWLRSRGNSIEGGTSEVQLNIIAKHVLGLPD